MPTLYERITGLTDPASLLVRAVYYFVLTFAGHAWATSAVPDLSVVKSKAFSRFWLCYVSPPGPQTTPLVGSAALVPGVFASASGDVLHIGPGSGTQVSHFASNPKIRKIYGAEPELNLHDQLEAEIRMAGLQGKYEVLACRADTAEIHAAMEARGAASGDEDGWKFDTVVCVRTLCSIPNPEGVARQIYHLLRPGGRLVVLEHVKNPWRRRGGSLLARVLQAMYMAVGWRFFVGGCCLDRDQEDILTRVGRIEGGWARVTVERHFGWSCLPYLRAEWQKA